MLSLLLRNKFQNFHFLREKFPPEENSKDQLKRIVGYTSSLAKELDSLSLSTSIDFSLSAGLSPDDLNRIQGAVNDLEHAATLALKRARKIRKGRPKDFSKESCIETAIQIYERACGQSFDKILKTKLHNRRQHMTALFSIMEPAITKWRYFQDMPSLKKFTLRYIEAGRSDPDDVAEGLTEEISRLAEEMSGL